MRICFIGPAGNYHINKWSKWFSDNGYEVYIISFTKNNIERCHVISLNSGANPHSTDISKLKYLATAPKVAKIVHRIKPDIISVHFLSSYGTVAALSGLREYYLSVWGADIYDFPKKSILHRFLVKFSLAKAPQILSTSEAMAKEIKKYTKKAVLVTPFGVDMTLFNPDKRTRERVYEVKEGTEICIGTVKGLEKKYGIRFLLEAVAILRNEIPDCNIKLRIAGRGTEEENLKKYGEELGITNIVTWLGFIPQESVAREWANMDIAVIPSIMESESFGVSAVEAQACATALIISDIPGLMEAACPNKSCLVVPRRNSKRLAESIKHLIEDNDERLQLGQSGRKYVETKFEINNCFSHIRDIYCGNV